MNARACALLLLASGCNTPEVTVSAAPIPLALGGNALTGFATVDGVATAFPVVVDTGTPLTVYDDQADAPDGAVAGGGTIVTTARTGNFKLFSAETPPVPRLEYDRVQLFDTPMRTVGLDPGFAVRGVLGGDNLQRSAVTLDYRRAAPMLTIVPTLTTCSCRLADECNAVFPFSLEGGQNNIVLGGNLYGYPATRVVLDACVEPLADPLAGGQQCATIDPKTNQTVIAPPYLTSGSEMRFLIATGFPGVALSQSAFDRLTAAEKSLGIAHATYPAQLHLPDPNDDGLDGSGLSVDVALLGATAGYGALALVSRETYFGPCGELGRSRRLRRFYTVGAPNEAGCQLTNTDPLVAQCSSATNGDCSDVATHTLATIVEIDQQLQIYVLPDTAPIFKSINGDVQPANAAVDGILGTDALKLLVSTVDYPDNRFIAQCASAKGCVMYPRFSNSTNCGVPCTGPDAITGLNDDMHKATGTARPGGLCPAAP